MSLQLAAQHLSHQGRGPDDTLVHMSKNELKSLSDLAMAHGGQLTINPQTGLPEAGMLDRLLPTIIGAGLTYFTGGAITPMQAGFITGGIETVRTGSLQKGLMAGLGAYGGAGLTAGLMGAGEASISAGANAALEQQMPGLHTQAIGDQGFGNAALQSPAVAGASNFDKLSGGVSQLFKDPSKVMDSMGGGFNTMKYAGSAISPLLGAEEVKSNMPKTTTQPGKVRTFSYNPYGQNYTPTGDYEVPVTAADGGLMGMYDGGSVHDLTNKYGLGGKVTPAPSQYKTSADMYRDILGREAENQEALDKWNTTFGDSIDVDEVSHFKNAAAPELIGRTRPDIANLYKEVLGRAPDLGGAAYWAKQFGDEVDPNEMATFIQASRPEITARTPKSVFGGGGGGGGGSTTQDKIENAAINAAASYFLGPTYDYARAADSFLQGDIGDAAGNLVSGFTGGISNIGKIFGFADGGYTSDQLDFAQRSEPVVRMARGGVPRYDGNDGSLTSELPRNSSLASELPPQNVEDLYTSILGRPSDAGGAAYWQNQFLANDNIIDQSEIDNFRKAANIEIANRPPAATGATTGAGTTGAGTTGDGFTFSPTAGTTAGFTPNAGIQELYTSILGRPADAGGAAYWQNQFLANDNIIDATERATFTQAATPERQVSDMYRNVLGRDPDPGGLQYWTGRINAGESPSQIYNEFLGIARGNTEMVTADDTKNKDFATATTPYTGYRSTDQTNVVDEWIRNTLGREPTEDDKRQSWYRDAFNANKSISDTERLYGDFQSFAKTDADKTINQKIREATASLTARGITESDVLRQTGKTIAELAASGIDLTKGLASASQLLAPGTKAGFDFSTLKAPTTTPKTNAPVGTTNPYGNITNPGDITRNADGSTTVTPNIPYRPYGGFSGMGEVRDAYTQGGGSLGYIPYAPKTMEEFNQLYNKQTGGSKQAYDYLTGKADYSATPYTKTGELMKPYFESVMGTPSNNATKKVLFDPVTKKYRPNPDYVPISYTNKGEKVYGLSNNEIVKRSTAGEDITKDSNVTYEQIAQALNISIDEAKKRYPGLAASTTKTTEVAPAASNTVGSYTGVPYSKVDSSGVIVRYDRYGNKISANGGLMDAYASGGMSHLGDYSDGGRLLRGPGDGVSDSIPAVIGRKQPARLADGEFVVPARIVSELGNGSTEAGARKLYAMMDRIQKARGKTVGKGKVAKNSRSEKYLPA